MKWRILQTSWQLQLILIKYTKKEEIKQSIPLTLFLQKSDSNEEK